MHMIRRHRAARLRAFATACVLVVFACAGATGAELAWPAQTRLAGYQHSQWTAENGLPADILGMAQTPDGWLWLSTSHGLYRFDGIRFVRAPGALGRVRTYDMTAAPGGELIVAIFGGGVSVLHPDGRVEELSGSDGPAIGTVNALAVDGDGVLWAVGNAIYRRTGQAWEAVDRDPSWDGPGLSSLAVDAQGRLWAASDAGVKRYDPLRKRFDIVTRRTGSLVLAPDGSMWALAKNGTGAVRLSAPQGPNARPARANPSGSRFAGLFDGAGTLWKLRCPGQSLCLGRAVAGAAGPDAPAAFEAAPGGAPALSGAEARHILEDREGNVWIATDRGLDRFRPGRLVHAGLPGGVNVSMAADGLGRLWAADNDGGLWQLQPGRLPRAVPGPVARIVARARDGGILVAGSRAIWRQEADGSRTVIAMPPGADGKPRDRKPFVLLDDGKMIWTATADTSLIGWDGMRWRSWTEFNLTDKVYLLVPGAPGQMWQARAGGELVFWDNGKRAHLDARAVGWITGIFPGADVVVGGDDGLGVLRDGHVRLLRTADPDALRGISGLVATPDGDRWLNGAAGVLHVRADDWRRALAQPDAPLRYERFGAGDGYPGRALVESGQPTATSGDGRLLWFIGTEGVATLDSAAPRRNGVAPTPQVEGVQTPAGMLAPAGTVAIAPGTARFGIAFTAPALRMPEKVRFEYRLDGFDSDWQDAGARRAAEYTQVPPGDYRFRVRAYNEDGVAGTGEATLALRVAPTMLQSPWFHALLAVVLAGLAAALYRYRVRYLTARLAERLRVKTAERERIARALHDSFLQSLQAVLMRLDAVAARLTDTGARSEIETIRAHASDALVEGRSHLAELRGDDAVELGEALARCLQQQRETAPGTEFVLRVIGEQRPLHDAVEDEVAHIAREALRNAATHAGARTVRVALGYGKRALTVSVADDGCGLPAEVARGGARPGHWGLAGMRERAERVNGLLVIDSQPGRGTTVRLAVPARQAYIER
ncbi:sensor histidine kinase [uncultured Massilia sp.]|uniref:sensor histidine kinase n=1 Tax=uncultured Massilia sp. TaxID=169973 RepID=UPI0025FF1516|nr:sensor histidine kinase [uncultured Massilia sp.]